MEIRARHARLWLVFGAGLMTSALVIFTNLVAVSSVTHQELDPFGRLFEVSFGVTWLIATLLPVILAVSAALMTTRYIRSEAYKLACRTRLSNWQLASILVQRVVGAGRDLIAFLAGLAPLWVVLAMFPSGTTCGGGCSYYWQLGSPFNDGLVTILALINMVLLIVLAIWGGVWLGLWWRRSIVATVGAFVLMSTLSIILIHLANVIIAFPADPFEPMPLPGVLGRAFGIYVAVPLILLIVVALLGTHSARTADQLSQLE